MVSFLFEPLLWSHHFAVGWCSRIFTSWWWRINICPQKIRLGKELCRLYTITLAAFIPAVKEEHLVSGGSGWQHQWREWTFGHWQACRQSVRFCLLSTAPTYVGVGATFTQALVIYRESPLEYHHLTYYAANIYVTGPVKLPVNSGPQDIGSRIRPFGLSCLFHHLIMAGLFFPHNPILMPWQSVDYCGVVVVRSIGDCQRVILRFSPFADDRGIFVPQLMPNFGHVL